MIRINILIPVLNDREGLKRTLESIKSQDFDQEDIFTIVVDFGSTDGSYEEALKYKDQVGVYRLKPWRNQSFRAYARVFWKETCPGGEYTFRVVMNSGDTIYPGFLKRCSELYIKYISKNPVLVICEADIRLKNGEIKKQPMLYEKIRIIDGKKEAIEYVNKGIMHSVYCFGGDLSESRHQMSGILNERFWWSNLLMSGLDNNILYIPERLACVTEREYEDELWEVLQRWENVINVSRRYEAFFGGKIHNDFEETSNKSVAFYALWRAFLLAGKKRRKEALDCFSMAEVIYPGICRQPFYQWAGDYIRNDGEESRDKLQRFFDSAKSRTIEEWEAFHV